MKFNKIKILSITAFASISILSCAQKPLQNSSVQRSTEISQNVISSKLPWSERMMQSEMERFPEAWMLDFHKSPKWSYPNGLVLKGAELLFKKTGKKQYYDYIKGYADDLVNEDGTIKTYDISKYNIDMLNSGNVLIYLYSVTKEEKYLKAIKLLRSQLDSHPRTTEGGFWHKKIYPNQMWLDGLYMGEPFYANYTKLFSTGAEADKAYNDIVNQFDVIQKHMVDPKTGLLYHGWDESKEQQWADKQTGLSPNFWGRAMGWYGMAIVDVLDYLPQNHPGREKLIDYLKSYSEALLKVQDKKTGLWYQVLDKGGEKGNYLEASASSMFVYTFAKAVRKGYLPTSYKAVAKKGYDGILKNLISVAPNGIINLNQNCAVAGLGGTPYRSGTYDYYVNEEIRSNDPKGTGPFILASLELEK
ncbi:glycoside hydrolase family 88/105 protein [Epilithonimonas caeni]|uniref:glycoside hydrolase family 88/105 protein n=1 Tax=Epilithonimonas caeni TaxID=365343 RepID=UPI00041D13E5|nr:glycoside hydrolase family 88 protein [Epilithonimonas caeni]